MPEPKRGEVWRVNLDPTRGDEMGKLRPCVVLSGGRIGKLRLRIIVPITDWKEQYAGYPWMSLLEPDVDNGLTKISAVDAFQIRSVSLDRFVSRMGKLSDERIERIVEAIALCIE